MTVVRSMMSCMMGACEACMYACKDDGDTEK